jgi:hypothetical protein
VLNAEVAAAQGWSARDSPAFFSLLKILLTRGMRLSGGFFMQDHASVQRKIGRHALLRHYWTIGARWGVPPRLQKFATIPKSRRLMKLSEFDRACAVNPIQKNSAGMTVPENPLFETDIA